MTMNLNKCVKKGHYSYDWMDDNNNFDVKKTSIKREFLLD